MQTFIPPITIALMKFVFLPQMPDVNMNGGLVILDQQWYMQFVQIFCWFYINLGGNRILRLLGGWMKYPSAFVFISQMILIPLLSMVHWGYEYQTTWENESNPIRAQLLVFPLMGAMHILIYYG